jgi:hypothetical protein
MVQQSTSCALTDRTDRVLRWRYLPTPKASFGPCASRPGHAGALLVAEVAIGNAASAGLLLGPRFWIRFGIAVLVSLSLWPVFLRLARRPGFLDGYGRYLAPTLLAAAAAAMFAALLGAETPNGLNIVASLVGARLT